MKQCRECLEWLDERAAVCKHCRYRFSGKEDQATRSTLMRGRLIGAAIAIVIFVLFLRWWNPDASFQDIVGVPPPQ